jgi:superfamily II DNA or RNA helicase
LIHELVSDAARNEMILCDAIKALNEGRFPVLVSDRKDHLERLEQELKDKFQGELVVVRMVGDVGKKKRREGLVKIENCLAEKKPVIILATGSLIGEGFDLPQLDTLLLTTPLSFKGRMVQYTGRLHRLADGKKDTLVYDYVDSQVAVTLGMYRKRVKAYHSMGYLIDEPFGLINSRSRGFNK